MRAGMIAMLACCMASAAGAREWPVEAVDWADSPVDLSFLNRPEIPAGRHGFLGARGDRLVFADGTPARFWGTNIAGYALFGTTPDSVRRQARRLSELGFNLVRLHHHDSPWVDPNVFGPRSAGDTRSLSEAMLERLDWWMKCLKDEGIYVWLDLHAGRKFKPGDHIDGFDEISKGKDEANLKGFNYVNPDIQAAMQRFNEQYLNHRNRYTGLRYKDEPAIIALLVTNENDITNHFGNALLPDRNVPRHSARFAEEAEAFARTRGLSSGKIRRAWEHGPAKFFLNDLERSFGIAMIGHLRGFGVRVPIATTSQWGDNPLSALPALTAGSIVDAHAYGGAGELEKNPHVAANIVHWLAAARVAGKPFSVSEWNVEPFPVADRHILPLYIAAAASHQGWDAVLQYAYTVVAPNGPGYPSNWHAFNDPSLLATLPAAALLYRRGDVREAATVYAFAPDKEQLFGSAISAKDSVALRTAAEKGKLVIALPAAEELPWLSPSPVPQGARIISDSRQSLLGAGTTEAVSDSGELRRNWKGGTYAIDTPRSQAALGRIGAGAVVLSDVRIEIGTGSASVAVQSLDGRPIARSRKILLSLGGQSMPKAAKELPFHSEPVTGRVMVRAPRGLVLYTGDKTKPLRRHGASYRDGRYYIDLDSAAASRWLVLEDVRRPTAVAAGTGGAIRR